MLHISVYYRENQNSHETAKEHKTRKYSFTVCCVSTPNSLSRDVMSWNNDITRTPPDIINKFSLSLQTTESVFA